MKRTVKTLLFFAFSLVICLGLCSCGEKKELGDNDILVKTIEDLDNYVIVRAENISDTVRAAVTELQSFILKNTGAKVLVNDDSKPEKAREIIVGKTSREIEGLDYGSISLNEYLIKLSGSKILIIGGSDAATANAVAFFMDTFIVDGSLRVPTRDGFSFSDPAMYESIKIDGNPLGEYTIVSDLYDVQAAEDFSLALAKATTLHLPVVKADEIETADGKYILLDDTNTDFSKYSIDIADGAVTFFANYVTMNDCTDYFISEIIGYDTKAEKIKGSNKIEITSKDSKTFEVEQTPIYTKEKLTEVLQKVYDDNDSLIIAQQITDLFSPVGEATQNEREWYRESCGVDVPMFGYDLGTLEFYESRRSENAIVKEAYDLIQFMREGGILTFSMHLDNPGTERDLDHYRGELRQSEWDEMFTEGTEINKNLMETLTFIGDFLEIFKINEAPTILRPLHEMNGNWFWFCIVSGTEDVLPQSYAVDFWKYLYDYFVTERGIDNMLWEYSPNVSAGMSNSITDVLYCYPGDEYVDLVALDWYTASKTDMSILETSVKALENTGKIFSMAEFGPSGDLVTNFEVSETYKFTCSDLHNVITAAREKEIKTAYWLLWSSYAEVKISMWNMGDGQLFYESDVYLTLEDTYKLLYE